MYFNVHKWKSVVFHSVSSVFKTHPCCYCTSRMLCDMTFWHPMIWSCHIWLLLQGEAPIPDPTMIALLLIHLYIWKFLFNIYPEKSCRTRLFQHLILLDIARMYSRTPIFIYSTTSSAWELHILISLVTFAIIELFGFFSVYFLHVVPMAHSTLCYQVTIPVILLSLCFLSMKLHSYFYIQSSQVPITKYKLDKNVLNKK